MVQKLICTIHFCHVDMQFTALNDTQKRINDMKAGLKLANIEMSAKQEKDALHAFYNEYLQTLGLDE